MQEFYASIKLKSGEEMLTIVTETCPEEDYIKVKNPIGVEELDIPGIIQGLKIGDNCVVGAGSVVTKDIPNNSIYAGIPAKSIK